MTYPQAMQYLESFINYEKIPAYSYKKSLKLERMKGFLKLLGNPQDNLRSLHIAGTKGKGSVCAFAAYILKEAGCKVGLYTSPHLVDFRERIRILQRTEKHLPAGRQGEQRTEMEFEGMISKREIARLVEILKPIIEKYNRLKPYGSLTFFEVYTALAFLYFKNEKVDYAVLETGLGGRLDATNTVNPLVCAITPISYDHMAQLGKTLQQIAREKAGIIKSDGRLQMADCRLTVISAAQEKEAREVIRNRCKEIGARLREVGKDIVWQEKGLRDGFQALDVQSTKTRYCNLKIKLLGEHQLANAALAIAMIEALNEKKITHLAIRKGLRNTLWPGRIEVISNNPRIVLDGAQNASSAIILKEAIEKYFVYRRLILVLGISQDKDIKGICQAILQIADTIILTKSTNPRAANPQAIKKVIDRTVRLTYNVKESVRQAKHLAAPRDLILITGSLFVAGEARRYVKQYP